MLEMLYTLFVFVLFGLTASIASKRRPHALGYATGTMLAQLVCLVVMRGIVTLVCGEVNSRIVWLFTTVIIVTVLAVWSVLCDYAKVCV